MTNLMNIFKETLKLEEVSDLTIDKYVAVVNEMLEVCGKNALEIGLIDLKLTWIKELKENNINRTINNKMSAVKKFYSVLKSYDLLQNDPTKELKLLKDDSEYERNIWTVEEISSIISNMKDVRTKAITKMLLATGLRISECLNITLDEYLNGIKLDENGNKYLYLKVSTKGNKWREIFVNGNKLQEIDFYIANKRKNSIEDVEYLFVSNGGKAIKPDNYNKSLKKEVLKMNIEKDITAHNIRASYITNIIETNSLEDACKIINHSSINTTQLYWNKSVDRNKMIMMSL